MNLAIFSPHEDLGDYTNRNIIYSTWLKKKKINSTLYVCNFNYRTKEKKKLKNFFYERQIFNGVNIYRIYTVKFNDNGIGRFISYLIFSFLSTIIFFLIDKKKYNYVMGESVPPICSLAAYLCSKKNNSNFFYTIRDPWPNSLVNSKVMKKNSLIYFFFEFINKLLIKKSIFIISVLPYLKNYLKKLYNYRGNIYYLRNPVDVLHYKTPPYPKIRDRINIVFAGGFAQNIQIINYFKAIYYIQKTKKNFSFSFYFLGKGIELKNCQSYVAQNNLRDIYFLKSRSKKKALKFLSKCHLCVAVVSSNKNSKFGYNLNKIVDYATSGRPIIFTNNLKKNCFVDYNNMGYNSSSSPFKIAEKILKFYKLSYNKKKIMAKNARKYALKELDIRKLHRVYVSILYKNLKI
jgi:hypothetical protein